MAIAYVDAKNGEDATGSSVASVATSATMNVAAGNLIVVAVKHQTGASITGVTDGGSNSCTSLVTSANASAGHSVDIYYKENASANATATFTASFSPNSAYPAIVVMQFSGVATASSTDATATGFADANSTVTSGSFTPAQTNEVAIAAAQENSNTPVWNTPTNYTLQAAAISGTIKELAVAYDITVAASSQTVSFSNDLGQYKSIAVATFKEAAGGGGETPKALALLGVG